MNLENFLPEKIRESYSKNLKNAGKSNSKKYISRMIIYSIIFSVIVSVVVYVTQMQDSLVIYFTLFSFIGAFFFTQLFVYFSISLKASMRIKRMEEVFPDFIGLMSSNLRAGMTIENSFLNSARPELSPLDKEIRETGKEIATGKSMVDAFQNMTNRIDSEKIEKVISLIISGLKTGGDISNLLQKTATNMREKDYLERRAASNVLMYVIFIFVAVGVGAPVLFGLSSVLVEVIIEITGQLPDVEATQLNMPLTMEGVDISISFIIYFSLGFILITDLISSLLIGLVNKGEEKYGLKYLFPLIILSLFIFFSIRILLSKILIESFLSIS